MKLERRTRSSCELKVGSITVLFSYDNPVAFHFPGLGVYELENPDDTKATRNHKIAFRGRDPTKVIPVPLPAFLDLLATTVRRAL